MRPLARTAAAVTALVILSIRPAAAQTGDFSGPWETTYGLLEMVQQGEQVTGTYSLGGGSTLSGTVDGNRLVFTYAEPQATGQGWFELSADGESFEGQWHEEGGATWYAWSGRRSARMVAASAGEGFNGLFESSYGRLRLRREGDGVTGSYAQGGGSTIEGAVEGERLVFRYQEPDAAGDGWFELSADGEAFAGAWRADGSTTWSEWNGTRVHPQPRRVWLVVLEAPWETSLAENEYSFGDMLRAYFERMPTVAVRHRRIYDVADFERAMREVTYLAEPVALLVASHGIDGELIVNGERLTAEHFRAALSDAPNVFLLHFSSCDTMTNGMPDAIRASLAPGRHIAISGYATFVDWAASALIEFLYLDLVLGRGLLPSEAAAVIQREIRFAGDTPDPASPLGAAQFRFVE